MSAIDVSNRGKRWSKTDSDRLETLYSQGEEWDVVKLAHEFKRTPCSIWSRLVQYNIISEPEEARGYALYFDRYAERYASLPPKPSKDDSHTQVLASLRNDIKILQKDVQDVLTLLQGITKSSNTG